MKSFFLVIKYMQLLRRPSSPELLYRTRVALSGNDAPTSSFSVRMNSRIYLAAALMELALHGYVRMDERKPLPHYARYNRVHSFMRE
jgi:hypothetical protein